MPNELQISQTVETIDSREAAEMIEVTHAALLKKVRNYEDVLLKSKLTSVDFFVPSEYKDSTGRTLNCYLLTKKGCEMVANKLTGEKGVIFTAQYVNRFEEMEKKIAQPQLPTNYLEALERLVDEVKAKEYYILENKQLRFKLEMKELEGSKLWIIEEIAREHNMSARALNQFLFNQRVQYSRKGRWYLFKKYKNKGYAKSSHNWLKWTNEGKLFIEQLLSKSELK